MHLWISYLLLVCINLKTEASDTVDCLSNSSSTGMEGIITSEYLYLAGSVSYLHLWNTISFVSRVICRGSLHLFVNVCTKYAHKYVFFGTWYKKWINIELINHIWIITVYKGTSYRVLGLKGRLLIWRRYWLLFSLWSNCHYRPYGYTTCLFSNIIMA